jgi:hypothetical protein
MALAVAEPESEEDPPADTREETVREPIPHAAPAHAHA